MVQPSPSLPGRVSQTPPQAEQSRGADLPAPPMYRIIEAPVQRLGMCKSGKRKDPELGAGTPTSNTVSLTRSSRMLLCQPLQMGQAPRLRRVSVAPPGATV